MVRTRFWWMLLIILAGPLPQVFGRVTKHVLTRVQKQNDLAMELLLKAFVPGRKVTNVPLQINPRDTVTNLMASVANHTAQFQRPLDNVYDMMYILETQIGTPPAMARLIVDTGSSDLWVRSTVYDPGSSSTGTVDPNSLVVMDYGKGHVEGRRVFDRVCFSSSPSSVYWPLLRGQAHVGPCVDHEELVAADQVLYIGNEGLFDGILGLAFPSLSHEHTTFLQEFDESGLYKRPAFGISIGDMFFGETSSISFGELDDLLAEAPSGPSSGVILPVIQPLFEPYWWIVPTQVRWSGLVSSVKAVVMLDSGTSLITIPDMQIWSVISGVLPNYAEDCALTNGFHLCTCTAELRPLNFTFRDNAQEATVTLGRFELFQNLGVVKGVPVCRFAIMSSPSTVPFWILGDAFLRKVYVVHDYRGLPQEKAIFSKSPRVILFSKTSQTVLESNLQVSGGPNISFAGCVVAASLVVISFVGLFWTRWRRRVATCAVEESYSRF